MGDKCREDMPTKGARTFQSAAMDTEFKYREARDLSRKGDWEGANKIHESISPMEREACSLAERKLGGGRGGATFQRDEILIPLRKEDASAGDYPSAVPKPSV